MNNLKKKLLIPLLAGISLIITACSESGDPVPQIQHESILKSIDNTIDNNPGSFELTTDWTFKDDNTSDSDKISFLHNPASNTFSLKGDIGNKITEVYHKYNNYYYKKDGKWYIKDGDSKNAHLDYSTDIFPESKSISTMLKYKDDIKIEENSKNYIIEFTPKNEELLKSHFKYYDSDSDKEYDYLTIENFKVKMIVDKKTNLILSSEIERKLTKESLTEPGKVIVRDATIKSKRKPINNTQTIDLPAEANNAIKE